MPNIEHVMEHGRYLDNNFQQSFLSIKNINKHPRVVAMLGEQGAALLPEVMNIYGLKRLSVDNRGVASTTPLFGGLAEQVYVDQVSICMNIYPNDGEIYCTAPNSAKNFVGVKK